MENVTDKISNPFGMSPPCDHYCNDSTERQAVYGYGDVNADFHVIGDHPNIHGGKETGIPFTHTNSEEYILDLLEDVGFIDNRELQEPMVNNCFLSYLYLCCLPDGAEPSQRDYTEFERFFDAELRAIAADVLIPVGETATRHVLETYTAKAVKSSLDMADLHGSNIHGSGFLVIPLLDPQKWNADIYSQAYSSLQDILDSDYHQIADLGRFLVGSDPYYVR
ncbi:MAG: uracil-DNA glycosylase family protein [Halobacteriaceae archaeon]